MIRAFIIPLLLALTPMSGFAQVPDTLDPRGYFPLAVGNSWEYEHILYRFPTGDETRYERYSIVASSLVGASEQFDLVYSERDAANRLLGRDTLRVRFDDTNSSILGDKLRGVVRHLTCLDSPFSPTDPVPIGCTPFVTRESVWSPLLFGETPVPSKRMGSYVWSTELVHGIGVVRVSGGCEPCGPFDDRDSWELKYAAVGGEHFGMIVMATQASPMASTFRMQVYPNPVDTWAVVESMPSVSISVYDILGRLMAQTIGSPLGRSRIDLSNLRAGAYVLRSGSQTTTILVR